MSENRVVLMVDRVYNAEALDRLPFIHEVPTTVLVPPNRFGALYPEFLADYRKVRFGLHGWEGSAFEFVAYTSEQIQHHIRTAVTDMGYHPIVAPPDSSWDQEFEEAIIQLNTYGLDMTVVHDPNLNPERKGISFFPGAQAARAACGEPLVFLVTPKTWRNSERLTRILSNPKGYEFCYPDDLAIKDATA